MFALVTGKKPGIGNHQVMNLPSRYSLDTELIASAISRWAEIESPSYDSVAVNHTPIPMAEFG